MSPTCMSTVVFALALSCMPLGMPLTRLDKPEDKLDNIAFGGDESRAEWYKKKITKVRPGSSKELVCDGNDCVGCTDYDLCWHGGGGFARVPGPLKLQKMKGRDVTKSYVVEVYAKCPTGGTWSVYVQELLRGNLVIYTDSDKSGHMKIWKEVSENSKNVYLDLPSSVKEARVRVAFRPTSSKKSSAYIMIKSKGVDPQVDTCMTSKECLNLLIKSEGYKLRNNNWMQLDCLEGRLESGICREWDQCVSRDEAFKLGLIMFLRAGVGRGGRARSLNQAVVASNGTAAATDPNTCVDPATDDAESWDCECLRDMKDDCEKKKADDLEECLKAKMCKFDAVCSHWKEENDCPNAMIQKEKKSTDAYATLMRRQVSTKSSAVIASDSELDGSMQGKCASQR